MTKRKNYSSAFKSKVSLEALRGELTLAEIASKHGVHQTQIINWKRQAMEGLTAVFSDKTEKLSTTHDETIKELHAKIGQLTVEKDFLERAFAKFPGSRGKK
jgi:transposase